MHLFRVWDRYVYMKESKVILEFFHDFLRMPGIELSTRV